MIPRTAARETGQSQFFRQVDDPNVLGAESTGSEHGSPRPLLERVGERRELLRLARLLDLGELLVAQLHVRPVVAADHLARLAVLRREVLREDLAANQEVGAGLPLVEELLQGRMVGELVFFRADERHQERFEAPPAALLLVAQVLDVVDGLPGRLGFSPLVRGSDSRTFSSAIALSPLKPSFVRTTSTSSR